MKKVFFLFLLCIRVCLAQQNFKENYIPLISSGSLPAVFTQNVQQVTKSDIEVLTHSDEKDKSLKSSYLVTANYQIERIIRSGNVLLNDDIAKYLNEVAGVVLKNDSSLKRKINIYTLRSPVVNAYSFDKGYIFVDIGLVAMAETEAQLAYLLCHEITHYTNKHNVNGYVRETKIDRKRFDGKSYEDKLIEKCQYSRELESEADIEGFKLFQKSNYDLKQAVKLFDVLQYSNLPFELVEFKKSFFETPAYKIPNKYVLKEIAPISDNSNEDDSKHTHPNTAKRKLAIAELISKTDNSNKVHTILGAERFEYTRDLARMEMCRLYLKYRDYPNALYAAYILKQKFPENQYLEEVIAKCLYSIALYGRGEIKYTKDSYLEDGFPATRQIEGYPQQFYYFINNMPVNDWTFMALNYVYRAHKKFPANKSISECSDMLFNLVKKTEWGISDFARKPKTEPLATEIKTDSVSPKEGISKTDLIARVQKKEPLDKTQERWDDSVYYKNIYLDLFMTDTSFARKFPASAPVNPNKNYASFRQNFSDKDDRNIFSKQVKVDSVLLLEPFYLKYNITKDEDFRYISSDKKQENYLKIVNDCAGMLGLGLTIIDPGLMNNTDVDKLNDYSTINDWLEEKQDSEQEKTYIFNNNNIDKVISKYGTRFIMKTGIVTVTFLHWANTYFYGSVYDLKNNETVYKRYEMITERDGTDMLRSKVYQMMNELKHPKK